MRRTWLVALAASALVGGMAAAQAGSSLVQQRTASVGHDAGAVAASDVSAARKKKRMKRMRRSGRTSTGTPRGREDSPTVNTGTKAGQEKSGVNKN